MPFYRVQACFAKAGAPSFRSKGYNKYLEEAREYFNMKSCLATNPKEILRLTIVDDETIEIILKSERELKLTQASRSLRVFSMYLIDRSHQPVNFGELVTGKRLFRTQASEYYPAEYGGRKNEQKERSDEELLVYLARLLYGESDSEEKREKIKKIWEVFAHGE